MIAPQEIQVMTQRSALPLMEQQLLRRIVIIAMSELHRLLVTTHIFGIFIWSLDKQIARTCVVTGNNYKGDQVNFNLQ